MRRPCEVLIGILLGLLLIALQVAHDVNRVGAGESSGEQMTWRVVGSGDSIMGQTLRIPSHGGAYLTTAAWIDTEYGRNAWSAGNQRRASLASIWPLVLSRSQPNGYIIIEDNGLGVSDFAWRVLLQRIVGETPADRTLVFILPVFHWLWSSANHNITTVRSQIMQEEAVRHRKRVVINWRGAVLGDRTMVYDGQHPSERGRIWLRRALRSATGLQV